MEHTIYKVFSTKLARRLLALGYSIRDIVANENNKERTVFLFKVEEGLADEIQSYKRKVSEDSKGTNLPTR